MRLVLAARALCAGLTCLLSSTAQAADMQARSPEQSKSESALNEVPGSGSLMPLRFATSGDFFYSISNRGRDDFHVGSLQLDVSLELSRYVDVSASLVYDGASRIFGVGSFTIDCGLAGKGSRYLLQSRFIERSGIVFGKFDVPFGIAYLEYSPVDNRLITQPGAVLATHGGWNDIGEQLYLQTHYFNVIAYLVNGEGAARAAKAGKPPDDALGTRIGISPFEPLEVGISAAALETD